MRIERLAGSPSPPPITPVRRLRRPTDAREEEGERPREDEAPEDRHAPRRTASPSGLGGRLDLRA